MKVMNVTESILQNLREKIITGELKPGYKLNEIDISVDLGISRPPLREAFRILEKDHMVVNIPRKGTYVSELSVKDFTEFSQTREMIECYSVDLLKAANIRVMPKVSQALDKAMCLPLLRDDFDRKKSIEYVTVILSFHNSLVESTENSVLTRIYESISYTLVRYQFIYFHLRESLEHSLKDHKKIVELIGSGDFDQAKNEMKRHIGYTVNMVKNTIVHRLF